MRIIFQFTYGEFQKIILINNTWYNKKILAEDFCFCSDYVWKIVIKYESLTGMILNVI